MITLIATGQSCTRNMEYDHSCSKYRRGNHFIVSRNYQGSECNNRYKLQILKIFKGLMKNSVRSYTGSSNLPRKYRNLGKIRNIYPLLHSISPLLYVLITQLLEHSGVREMKLGYKHSIICCVRCSE